MTAAPARTVVVTDERPPSRVDRLVVHQFDPAQPSPGGIDTCLRGICRYLPEGLDVAVVGVDTGADVPGRRLGHWEQHSLGGGRPFWFLPVARLDPADGARRVPHGVRLVAGLLRHRLRLPDPAILQLHRMDAAFVLRLLLRRPTAYFIHTQENGLSGRTSDSFWRFAGNLHQRMERSVVAHARDVVVFNRDYAGLVRRWNPRARFSPTWYDPALVSAADAADRDPHRILWVGRLEVPKDPALAVSAFAELVRADPERPWSLELLGSGSLLDTVREQVAALPPDVAARVDVRGRVAPADVAHAMAAAGLFLMTSHPGYEGYPRVLVESMASGLPSVVTDGSDTGGLVVSSSTGYVCGRDPAELAGRLEAALDLDRATVRAAVAALSAPTLVARILDPPESEIPA